MKKIVAYLAPIAVMAVAVPSAADAAVTVAFNQVGSNVTVTTTGSLNLSGLTFFSGGYTLTSGVSGNTGYVGTGLAGAGLDAYSGFTGPASFGSGNLVQGTGAGATPFGLNAGSFSSPIAFVQTGYTSGSAISSTTTFANSTFASLGLTQGVYAYSSRADAITVTIGQAATGAVPEPATWGMMILGFGAMGYAMRRGAKMRNHVAIV